MKKVIIFIVLIVVVIATVSYAKSRNASAEITNFDECIAAGNPMLKSYPAQCKTSDGRTFIQEIAAEPSTNAEAAARAELAKRLSVQENSITIVSSMAKEWSDGCLGLGGAAESCLFAITPGYEVKMIVDGVSYTYRTDESGTSVRAEN